MEITAYIVDPETGAIMCPLCETEMARCDTKHGFACDETVNGHFLSAKYVSEHGGKGEQ